ncbi:Glutamate mutase epsilon subunit (plasmid) [Streptomyces sp. enrichment culture]|uniref:methylaspartate mutase n=1 Tax=Streptomyces sp. enrichment culture TaxID=1795815 RepID=UPI003F57DDFA
MTPPGGGGKGRGPAAVPARSGHYRSFGDFIAAAQASGRLVVQPRMGTAGPQEMRAGLQAVKQAKATTVGTITLDSHTRRNDHAQALRAIRSGAELNGFPIVAHGPGVTADVLGGLMDASFPVQVRHGAPAPQAIVATMAAAGLDVTEGGPVSYCLPYSREPLRKAVDDWAVACQTLAGMRSFGYEPHLETFGGCMMGQLCPPSLLVAISVLEAMFFRQHGVQSLSMSYAQQASLAQDLEAVEALRTIASQTLGDADWHIVLYAYMGVFPKTARGALLLLEEAVRLAVRSRAARLIVKTTAEAHRIPTTAENVRALEFAAAAADRLQATERVSPSAEDTGILTEAQEIISAVLGLDRDVGRAIARAFELGVLDVPYCLHPDNKGRTRAFIDQRGRLNWASTGSLPVPHRTGPHSRHLTSAGFLNSLNYVANKFDGVTVGDRCGAMEVSEVRPWIS